MNVEILNTKEQKLMLVSAELKKRLLGIDNVIDKFINAVSVWYLMPELMTRPVIVNLWGLTGIGKTSLVREFVQLINMGGSFIEVQMDEDAKYGKDKIKNFIDSSDIECTEPSILLLDEIQRFRTIDDKGSEIVDNVRFQDIWMLLSDGKFQSASRNKSSIMEMIMMDMVDNQCITAKKKKKTVDQIKEDENEAIEIKYKRGVWSAREIKRLIKTEETIEQIMMWSNIKKIEILNAALANDKTFEGETYPKILIIISGNIYEAYSMANDINDADTDADIFHEFSKTINIVNIKEALLKRFKPEQIARFGNNHIIYPSLTKSSYQKIIQRYINEFCENVKKHHKITITLDDSIYSTIYENGVFSTQGVRPVVSTISCIFENYIPNFLIKAMKKDITRITLKYVGSQLICDIGGQIEELTVELAIHNIKENKSISERVLTSTHEAGHTITYSILNKIAPTQIKSSTSDSNKEGFVGIHMMTKSKKLVRDIIVITLAGQAAEEIVFGEEYKSAGASSDISYATQLAADYVRTYAFDGMQSKIMPIFYQGASCCNTDIERTNSIVENLLIECKKRAIDIINANSAFFKHIAQRLIDNGEIKSSELCEIAKEYDIALVEQLPKDKIIHEYEKKWEQYVKNL